VKKDRLLAMYRRNRNNSSPNILRAIIPGGLILGRFGAWWLFLWWRLDVVVLCVFSYILMPAPDR
jgi:hypothetical protein